jgi:hypothetical protein
MEYLYKSLLERVNVCEYDLHQRITQIDSLEINYKTVESVCPLKLKLV